MRVTVTHEHLDLSGVANDDSANLGQFKSQIAGDHFFEAGVFQI